MPSNLEIIKRTGEMMLSGWKMLATSCPICSAALLSKGSEMRCPGCNLPVVMEGAAPTNTNTTPRSSVTSSHAASAHSEENTLSEEIPTSYEEMKLEYDRRNSGMRDVSKKLGEKMLAGWAMLGICCPSSNCGGTPLVMKKGPGEQDSKMHCVCCGDSFTEDDGNTLTKVSASHALPPPPPAATSRILPFDPSFPPSAPSSEAHSGFDVASVPLLRPQYNDEEDQASEKMATYLLKGWAMLEQSCPGYEVTRASMACKGTIPLLRSKDGKRFCVNCGFIDELKPASVAGVESVVRDSKIEANAAKAGFQSPAKAPTTSATARTAIAQQESTEEPESLQARVHMMRGFSRGGPSIRFGDIYEAEDELTPFDITEQGFDLAKALKPVGVGSSEQSDINSNPIRSAVPARLISRGKSVQAAEDDFSATERRLTKILYKKLETAGISLEEADSIETSTDLANLIVKLGEAVRVIASLNG